MVNDGSYWVIRVNLWIINNGEWWCFCGEEWWIPRAVSATNSLLGQSNPALGTRNPIRKRTATNPMSDLAGMVRKCGQKGCFVSTPNTNIDIDIDADMDMIYVTHVYVYIYIHVFMLPPKTSVLIVCRGHGLWLKVVVNSAFLVCRGQPLLMTFPSSQ